MKNRLLIFFLLFSSISTFAQHQFSTKIIALGIQPFSKNNLSFYKQNLDKEALVNFEPGLILAYETYPRNNRMAWSYNQGVFLDAAGKIAGFTHIALKTFIVDIRSRQQIWGFAFGPALFYRKSWNTSPEYNSEKYNKLSGLEYRILPSFHIQYNVRITQKNDLSIAIHHIEPKTITLAIAYLFYSKRPENPCDCPKFKKH